MKKLSDLVEVGKPCTVEYVEDGQVIITAYWRVFGPYDWALFDANNNPLKAAQDVILDANWRIK